MNIRVIDFEKLTRHYKNYQSGVELMKVERDKFLLEIEPLRKEINNIISDISNDRDIDQSRFEILQQDLLRKEQDFKYMMKGLSDEIDSNSYSELSEIIIKWSKDNSIDLVTGKMEVVFCNPDFESTDEILDILKDNNLFI